MARNSEKQYGRLNRMLLDKQVQDRNKKFPKRPHLESLHTVDEIKQWLPAIKQDIDFNLKQSQVICYSETKIEELHVNVVKHEQEYKRFVRKIKELDSYIVDVPWTDRPYQSKRAKTCETTAEDCNPVTATSTNFIPIATPILQMSDSEREPLTNFEQLFVVSVPDLTQSLPLEFDQKALAANARAKCDPHKVLHPAASPLAIFHDDEAVRATESKLKKVFGIHSIGSPRLCGRFSNADGLPQSTLNLAYSDSSDDGN